ncbi:hypothetical protein FACS1894170_10230 [Planctomycetales bacterium]|nr:hypothetical protein FACS1894170_10230 [Planctomycetales bacterium]
MAKRKPRNPKRSRYYWTGVTAEEYHKLLAAILIEWQHQEPPDCPELQDLRNNREKYIEEVSHWSWAQVEKNEGIIMIQEIEALKRKNWQALNVMWELSDIYFHANLRHFDREVAKQAKRESKKFRS